MERPFPSVTHDRLLNGLQILIAEDHREPSVFLKLIVKYGAAFDLQGKSGTACMTVRAMAATEEGALPEGAKPKLLDPESRQQGVECGQDDVAIWIRVSKRDAPTALRYLARLVTDASFSDSEIDRARQGQIDPVRPQRPLSARVDVHLRKMLYPRHPYARDPHGDPAEGAAIQRPDLVRFHRQFFIANQSVLLVVGDVEREALLPIIRPSFGPMRKAEPTPAGFVLSPFQGGPRIRLVNGGMQAGVGIAAQLVGRGHTDYLPLSVLARVLGVRLGNVLASLPGEPASTRTFQDLMEGHVLSGYLEAIALVPSPAAGRVLAALLETWRKLDQTPISNAELEAARSWLLRDFEQRLGGSRAGITGLLGEMELYRLGRDWAMSYGSRLSQLTTDDLHRVARTYLKPENTACVIIGEVGDQLESIRALGTVEGAPPAQNPGSGRLLP